jgi:hypothetical protein
MQFLEPLEDPEGEIDLLSRGVQYGYGKLFPKRFAHSVDPKTFVIDQLPIVIGYLNDKSPFTNDKYFFSGSSRKSKTKN